MRKEWRMSEGINVWLLEFSLCFACPVCSIFTVNGNWGVWSEYDICTKTCGGGKQTRRRACDNPSPQNGGEKCSGEAEEQRDCNMQPCKGRILTNK